MAPVQNGGPWGGTRLARLKRACRSSACAKWWPLSGTWLAGGSCFSSYLPCVATWSHLPGVWERGGPKAVPVQNGGEAGKVKKGFPKQCLYKMVALEWQVAGRWLLLLFLSTLCGYMVASSQCLGEGRSQSSACTKGGPWGAQGCKVTSLLKKGVQAAIFTVVKRASRSSACTKWWPLSGTWLAGGSCCSSCSQCFVGGYLATVLWPLEPWLWRLLAFGHLSVNSKHIQARPPNWDVRNDSLWHFVRTCVSPKPNLKWRPTTVYCTPRLPKYLAKWGPMPLQEKPKHPKPWKNIGNLVHTEGCDVQILV